MDGLTIRNGQSLIDAGKTASELRTDQFKTYPRSSDISSQPFANPTGQTSPASQSQKSFADTLKEAVGTVNQLQKSADQQAQALATGKTTNIPEVMMAAEKADLALRMMVQVRNKIIDAYNEVMKMQV